MDRERDKKTAADDWITAFMQATEGINSPAIFRKWGAIAAVAGALERKVWIRSAGSTLFPNMYIIFIAPPGGGKSETTWRVQSLWRKLSSHHVASGSVSRAALIDDLREAERTATIPGGTSPLLQFHSLLVCANELGVLLPTYDNEFMNTLTDLWDGKVYSERKRTRDLKFELKRPILNLLAAGQPAYLRDMLPEGAWDQGFLSRTILIFNSENIQVELNLLDEGESQDAVNTPAFDQLAIRLQQIGNVVGRMKFTKEAAEFIHNWHNNGRPPVPTHPKLANYNVRRTLHLLKLSMISSISADPTSLIINLPHVERALDWLLEAEIYMPDIFKSMSVGGDAKVIEETWFFLYTLWKKNREPIPEHRLVAFLQARAPIHKVMTIIEIMVRAKIIHQVVVPKTGTAYKPASRKE